MRTALLAAMLLLAGLDLASGSDILIVNVDGQLAVGSSGIDNGGNYTLGERVFEARLVAQFATNQPGFNALPAGSPFMPAGAQALPGLAELGFSFLPMTNDSIISNLLYWDGVGTTAEDVEFTLPPSTAYRYCLYGQDGSFGEATGTDQIAHGPVLGTTNSAGYLHDHRIFLVENQLPPFSAPASGLYLAAIQLEMQGLESSLPVYVLLATSDIPSSQIVNLAGPWIEDRIDTLIAPPMLGDFDHNQLVDGADALFWQRQLGPSGMTAGDLQKWKTAYAAATSNSAAALTAVPEPTVSVLLFSIGAGWCGLRRMRRGGSR